MREILPRNNFQQSFTPKCILHSKYVFSTREFEKISSKSFDTRYLSRVERSYEIHDLKNSTTCRILESFPFKRERRILDARKKRKKNISFRRSFQRSFQLLCGKSRLDSRIFGRIFRETRLLRIIQTNHEFSMNSRLGIDPLL